MTTKEILDTLNGCEVNSLEFEGCVGINNGKIYQDGEIIRATPKQIKILWDEYIEEEGIHSEFSDLFGEDEPRVRDLIGEEEGNLQEGKMKDLKTSLYDALYNDVYDNYKGDAETWYNNGRPDTNSEVESVLEDIMAVVGMDNAGELFSEVAEQVYDDVIALNNTEDTHDYMQDDFESSFETMDESKDEGENPMITAGDEVKVYIPSNNKYITCYAEDSETKNDYGERVVDVSWIKEPENVFTVVWDEDANQWQEIEEREIKFKENKGDNKMNKNTKLTEALDFTNGGYAKSLFRSNTKEYDELNTMDDADYQEFIGIMSEKGITVKYDKVHDEFIITDPQGEGKFFGTPKTPKEMGVRGKNMYDPMPKRLIPRRLKKLGENEEYDDTKYVDLKPFTNEVLSMKNLRLTEEYAGTMQPSINMKALETMGISTTPRKYGSVALTEKQEDLNEAIEKVNSAIQILAKYKEQQKLNEYLIKLKNVLITESKK